MDYPSRPKKSKKDKKSKDKERPAKKPRKVSNWEAIQGKIYIPNIPHWGIYSQHFILFTLTISQYKMYYLRLDKFLFI